MNAVKKYQAILIAPFGVLGIMCSGEELTGIDFLAPATLPEPPANLFAQTVCKQLAAYFDNPDFEFTIPLKLNGSVHQRRVWHLMCTIPRGQTRQYGEIAKELASSPRAVGQACGANPIPVVIPCHRVVSKAGMGGFANHRDGYELDIKRWLLEHETVTCSAIAQEARNRG